MVKVLARAPQRWKRIYCLSRRPPPGYFLKELSDGASQVEHVAVDFLDDPARIAGLLQEKKIQHVLIRTFTDGLEASTWGPGTKSSFESDPRVLFENNFCFPREDLLFKYCEEVGAKWNVVRPSYLIGAVRDKLLNHMMGISVHAAVQAHLWRPLFFSGDFVARDKEIGQSTAMLNGYFEEWAVHTDHAADKVFNVQDGLNFPWGKFWPYLASCYGHAVTKTTFSLQEWSGAQDFVDAWKQLSEKHGLRIDLFKDRAQIIGLSDSAILGGWPLSLSMRKARKVGFHGTVDSFEATFKTLQGLVRMQVAASLTKEHFEEIM